MVKKIKTYIFFLVLFNASNVFSQNLDRVLLQVEKKQYNPIDSGLKDLYFEIESESLRNAINEQKSFGKISSLLIKVWFLKPSNWKVEISGLPKGFKELRNSIKNSLQPYLNFVVSEKFRNQLKNYKKTLSRSGSLYEVKGIDFTASNSTPEILLYIDKNFRLSKVISKRASGTETSRIKYKKYPWSQGKNVIDGISIKTIDGLQTVTATHKINYFQKDKIGFPVKISTRMRQVLQEVNPKTKRPLEKIVTTQVKFKNYQVNQGLALKKLAK